MSIKKLLCGAAMATVFALPATALDLEFAGGQTSVQLAEEVDFTGTVAGNVATVELTTLSNLPLNNGYKLTINLTGDAVFGAVVPGTVVSSGGTLTGQIVSTGGVGTQSVTILFDAGAADVGFANAIDLSIPVDMNSCSSDVGLNIVLTDPNDNPIEGGVASLQEPASTTAADLVECVDAFELTFADDGDQTQLTLASNFTAFDATVANDTATVGTLSDIEVTVGTAVGSDLTTAVVVGDITSLDFEVNVPTTTGITQLATTVGAGAATTVATGMTSIYDFTVGTVTVGTSLLQATINGTDAISPQQPTIQNAILNFGAGFTDEAATVTSFGADSIDLEGASFGEYDWTGDSTTPTQNIFRVTGLTALPQAAVVIRNSTTGVDGTYTLDLSGKTLSGNTTTGATELLLTSADIQTAVGSAFGRADVTFTFFTSDTVDVDRLLLAGGVVTDFGNNAATQGDD